MNVGPTSPVDSSDKNTVSSLTSHLKTVSHEPCWWTRETKKITAVCSAFWLASVASAVFCHALGSEVTTVFSVYVASSATVTFLGYAVTIALRTRRQASVTEPSLYPEGVDYHLPEKEPITWPSPDGGHVYISNVFCGDYGGCEYCPGQGPLADVMGDPTIPPHIRINCIHSCHGRYPIYD